MGEAERAGRPMSVPDGMIAAAARILTRRRWRRGTWRTFGRRVWCWWIRGGAERGDVSRQDLSWAWIEAANFAIRYSPEIRR